MSNVLNGQYRAYERTRNAPSKQNHNLAVKREEALNKKAREAREAQEAREAAAKNQTGAKLIKSKKKRTTKKKPKRTLKRKVKRKTNKK